MNDFVFGSVNVSRRHYEQGVKGLADADPGWLGRMITRREPLERVPEALVRKPTDIKVVLGLT